MSYENFNQSAKQATNRSGLSLLELADYGRRLPEDFRNEWPKIQDYTLQELQKPQVGLPAAGSLALLGTALAASTPAGIGLSILGCVVMADLAIVNEWKEIEKNWKN